MQHAIRVAALFVLLAFFGAPSANAQSMSLVLLPGGCGSGAYTGGISYLTVDSTGKLCVNATVSATITFPTFGATFPTTGIAMGFSQGGNLVAATGTSGNLNVNCASGCSGGGGGAVTIASGAVASGAYSAGSLATGAGVDGWNLTEGTKADAPCTLPATTTACSEVATQKAIANAVNSPVPAGTNLIGKVGIDQTTAGSTNAVTIVPSTLGGWTKWSTPKNNSNTALLSPVVAVKSSAAGTFGGYFISNPNATAACMQVFDIATAGGVTLGTTRPDMVFCVPATSGANIEFANGAAMANGIQVSATTTASGSTAPPTGLDVTVLYK